MNRKNMTTLLSRIALEQDTETQQRIRQFSDGKKTGGTPMAIRFRPAVREFITRVSRNLGISAAELVNMVIEGVMLHTLTPRQATVTHMYDRFWQLMDAHRLSLTNVATLLADMNMGVSVLESRERTLDYLTTPVIGHIAASFGVSPDWLDGTDDHPVRPVMLTRWSEVADPLFSASDVTAPTINLVRRESPPPTCGTISHKDDIIVCISRLKKVNGINLRVIDFTGVMRNAKAENKSTDAFLAFCETMRKAARLGAVNTLLAPEHLFSTLADGREIPVSVFIALNNYCVFSENRGGVHCWGVDDMKGIVNSEFYLSPEWEDYRNKISRHIE